MMLFLCSGLSAADSNKGCAEKPFHTLFEQTVMWQSAQRQAGELRFDSNGHGDSVTLESLLDELRLEGPK
jgi:hypothetical protein